MPGLPNAGYSPPVHMIRLTETREIAPYSSGRWTLAVPLCTEILIPTGPRRSKLVRRIQGNSLISVGRLDSLNSLSC
jgi:hypothetical protein